MELQVGPSIYVRKFAKHVRIVFICHMHTNLLWQSKVPTIWKGNFVGGCFDTFRMWHVVRGSIQKLAHVVSSIHLDMARRNDLYGVAKICEQ